MRIVLSIEAGDGWEDPARWVLREMIGAIGLDLSEEKPEGGPFCLLLCGPRPSGLSPDIPTLVVPFSPPEPPERYRPEVPDEILGVDGAESLAFPPYTSLPAGEVLWRRRSGEPAVVLDADHPHRVHFAFDPVAPSFYLLSRFEEREGRRDCLDRFLPDESWAASHRLEGRPVVDLLASLIDSAVETACARAGRGLFRKAPWPGGESFAVALTHDQDQSVRWERRLARHLLGLVRGRRAAALRLVRRDIQEGVVPPTVLSEKLVGWERSAGIRSTFFFLTVPSDRFDRRYKVASTPFRRLIRRLDQSGFAVGLHGSLETYRSAERLKREREIVSGLLGREARGVRQHYLRLQLPDTWRQQRSAGFAYDASLGYPDLPGFRGGTSFPFRPFGVDNLIVLPLLGMDRALLAAGVTTPFEWDRWSEPVRSVGGLLHILWHPYFIDPDSGPGKEAAFRNLLAWVQAQKGSAWISTLDEVAEWWASRRSFCWAGASVQGERTFVRYRSSVAIPTLTLSPVPASSDIRIESVSGADAAIGGDRGAHLVHLKTIEPGAEVSLSLQPLGRWRNR